METNQTEAGDKKLYFAAIIALVCINLVTGAFLFYNVQTKNEITDEKITLEATHLTLEKDYHQVTDSLDAQSLDIGQLKGKNAELDKIILEKQEMIEQAKNELSEAFNQNTLTTAKLNKARRIITQYEESIAALEKRVEEFAVQTQQLTAHNEKLSTDLSCEQETTAELNFVNTGLSKKIEAASFLEIPKVEVEAIKRKNNGGEVVVSKAKAAENLKISFETGANKALEPGKVSLYVRVINPKGETISVSEQGSGIIPLTESSKPVQYTKKTDIQWNQKNKTVIVYWARYINLPGTYKVELYQSGRVVGRGAVRLS